MVFITACFILYVLHHGDSYVLLTANVDDVHSIANQVAKSPVASQIKEIWQQAARTFYEHYEQDSSERTRSKNRGEMGRTDNLRRNLNPESIKKDSMDARFRRRKAADALVDLGRNASVYLRSLQKVLENLSTYQ